MAKTKTTLQRLPEKFGEAWLSCLVTMVGGDVTVLTLSHALVATKVGVVMALSYAIARVFTKNPTNYLDVVLTGVLTAVADILVHPSHFGGPTTEAIVTGIGAALLALLLHLIHRERT